MSDRRVVLRPLLCCSTWRMTLGGMLVTSQHIGTLRGVFIIDPRLYWSSPITNLLRLFKTADLALCLQSPFSLGSTVLLLMLFGPNSSHAVKPEAQNRDGRV